MNGPTSEMNPAVTLSPYSAKRTRHHVTFFCRAPGAKQVCLVGDFNEWLASLELTHGHHQYLFLVDGRPVLDPKASGIARNDRNERVSLVAVS